MKLARHQLLRCYLDQGEAGKARQLLDQWGPSDSSSSCFSFSRALIEHISWTVLQEPGSSEALRDEELAKGEDMCVCVCVCVCIHTYLHTYIHTYIHTYTLTACSQLINLFNPNRTSTLSDLHSLKYTYIHC